jgi:hypothetical protein
MIRTQDEQSFAHYGTPRKSGRYPWGSGGDPANTRNRSFLDTVAMLRKDGMTDAEIAKGMGMTRNELVAKRSIQLAQQKQDRILQAQSLKDKGLSNVAIGQRMGLNESSVRALLAPGAKDKATVHEVTAKMLREQVAEKKMVDIGKGVEAQLGLTKDRLNTAVALLKEEGYVTHNIKLPQQTTGKFTTQRVLAVPGTTKEFIQRNRAEIKQINEYSPDHGRSFLKPQPPLSISSRRIGIIYAEDGGANTDGMIYVRPGVKDLQIGKKRYAQVRVMVDGTHYLKGMAIYKDDLPPGKDIMFSTKQHRTSRKKDAMKEISKDPELPFGSIVRQIHGPNGKVISAMNIVGAKEGAGEEGAWDTWKRSLPSQMLSKQDPRLVRQQLDLTYDRRVREFNEINSLTNPTVRKDLLLKFGEQTDSAAVHLAAAAMPKQVTKVLLPVPSMRPTEVYAPTFRNGDLVALVRFPHGGTFEIPQLIVNNRNHEARRLLGPNPRDAIGIHHKVAERLSGADFDGDTVLVIPNNKKSVKSTAPLEGLKDFDPMKYKLPKDSPVPRMDSHRKGVEMGKISNLITDMTIRGANTEQLSRAIRHSMIVIDAQNHELDFRKSEKDHGIHALKEEYQGGKQKGASTLLSRAGAQEHLPQRISRPAKRGGPIDPVTGKRVYEETGYRIPVGKRRTVRDPATGQIKREWVETGATKLKTEEHKKMAVVDDAYELLSPNHPPKIVELIYADHANRLKALANTARKEAVPIKGTTMSPSAKKVYANEVTSLDSKLRNAERNAPLERQAQLLAQVEVGQKRQANPGIEAADLKKIKIQALNTARLRTGAKKQRIEITQSEWNAIQAGAVSTNKLEKILNHSDRNRIKELALPKQVFKMTSAKQLRAQRMLDDGYTQAEVADHLGVGLTTLKVALSE